MEAEKLSILSRASKLDVKPEPFPHVVIRDALEPEIFARLEAEYPDPAVVLNSREKKDTWYDYPACLALQSDVITPIWKEFLRYHTSGRFFREVANLFGEQIAAHYPQLETVLGRPLSRLTTSIRQPGAASNPENYKSDVSLECQFYINYTEQPRAVRGPHVDRPSELYAALLYFKEHDDPSQGSNLQICETNGTSSIYPGKNSIRIDQLPMEVNDTKVQIVEEAVYEANTLVMFLNTCKSIHSVSPRTACPIPRKHINFTADLFGLAESNPLFEVVHTPRNRAKLTLESSPIVWRLSKYL